MNYAYTYDMRVLAILIAILFGFLSWVAFPAPAKAALIVNPNPQSAMTGKNSYTIPVYVGTSTEEIAPEITATSTATSTDELAKSAPVEIVNDRSTRLEKLRDLIRQLEELLRLLKEKGV